MLKSTNKKSNLPILRLRLVIDESHIKHALSGRLTPEACQAYPRLENKNTLCILTFCLCYRISSKLSVERFYTIVQFKGLRGLADPGEAVGLLAAQVRLC